MPGITKQQEHKRAINAPVILWYITVKRNYEGCPETGSSPRYLVVGRCLVVKRHFSHAVSACLQHVLMQGGAEFSISTCIYVDTKPLLILCSTEET